MRILVSGKATATPIKQLSFAALFVIGVAVPSLARGQTAPQELRGKSITITWNEYRNERRAGWTDFRDISDALSLRVYVGTTGRPFARFTTMAPRASASTEHVGTSGRGSGGGFTQFQFAGHSLVVTGETGSGDFARRYMVNFNESYNTCEAQIIFAKKPGASVLIGRNLYTGLPQEIRSARATGVTCSVRDGNMFAQ